MAWACVDDGWWSHPKVMGLPLAARGLWVSALSWSCHQRKPVVPATFLRMVGGTDDDAAELVAAGLWEASGDGWQVVDWQRQVGGFHRPNIPVWIRRYVLDRDGRRCLRCGTTERLSLDHIVPFSHGGPDTPDNLRTLCVPCNSSRGAGRWEL